MSGGVDSAVAAAFLKEQGYQVTGVTFNLYEDASRCGNTQAIQDAQKIAQQLLIPHYILDLKKEFQEQIIDYLKPALMGKLILVCGVIIILITRYFKKLKVGYKLIPYSYQNCFSKGFRYQLDTKSQIILALLNKQF